MKTFNLIGLALLAMSMCVGFTACSSDDDPEQPKEEISEKKLIEFKITGNDEARIYFSYKKGQLQRAIYNNYTETLNSEYYWNESKINCVGEQYESIYTLNKGLVKVAQINNKKKHTKKLIEYNYLNKQLKDKCEYDENGGKDFDPFVWENDKLSKFYWGEEAASIEYGDKVCKGYFPYIVWKFHYYDCEMSDPIYLAHPELIGMKSKYLPIKIIDPDGEWRYISTFEYGFDHDNYVTTCKVTEYDINTSIPNYEDKEPWIQTFYFTWE